MLFTTWLNQSAQNVGLRLHDNERMHGTKIFGATELSDLIGQLGWMRAQLDFPVQENATGRAAVVADPQWRVNEGESAERTNVTLCHPGFGWLKFELSADETIKLGNELLATAELTKRRE